MKDKTGAFGIRLAVAFIILSGVAAASPFAVSAIGNPQLNLTTNRLVILDDPSGWDGGSASPAIIDRGNQWSAESTTIQWYVLLINSSGRAAQGITVTSQLLFPNGTVALTKTNTTDSFGIAQFDQDMDRWLRFNGSGSEGIYTINAVSTADGSPVAASYNFIYDEWGCGSSGAGCHRSQFWQSTGINSQLAGFFAAGSVQNSPYLHAFDNFHSNADGHGSLVNFGTGECLTCHRGFDGANRTHGSRVTTASQFSAGIHSGKTGAACTDCHDTFGGGTMPILQCYDCHPIKNNNLSVKTFSQTAASGFSFQPLLNSSIMAHNAGQNISCIICHNGMHNVSKPNNATGTSNTFTEFQQCAACHNAQKRHNDSVSCTVCHSQDAHLIKTFSQNAVYVNGTGGAIAGNCTGCHQNLSFLSTLLLRPGAGFHSGSAPQVSKPTNHSDDPLAGRKWNQTPGYWTNGTTGGAQLSSCRYCHGETLHKTIALGRPSLWQGSNTVNSAMGGASWCASCHDQGYASGTNNYNDMVGTFQGDNLPVPPEITGNATYGANQISPSYFNHSNITGDDSSCNGCHGNFFTGAGITALMHGVSVGTAGGGADCIGCHDVGGTAGAGRLVNFTAMNDPNAIHSNLNINAVSPSGFSQANFKCWACHGNGSEPGNQHPPNYRTPYNCTGCHVQGAGQNLNFTPRAILNVTQHYQSGITIKTPAASACYDCHNKSEMMQGGADPDGAASVSGGANGGNNSTSHYGKKRPDLRAGAATDCLYCHQNISTAFMNAMQKPDLSSSIPNHTDAAFPGCGSCHGTGFIHNSTLSVPALDNDFCLGCHAFGIGSARPIPVTHNSTMNCWNCHQDPGGIMFQAPAHGMMYPQENGSYLRFNKGIPANCVTCHVNNLVNTSANLATIVPPLNHSTDPQSGRKWGSYWDNTSMITACYYCHKTELHNLSNYTGGSAATNLFGNVTLVKGSNIYKNPDLSSSTWCANCHYGAAAEYNGLSLTPVPPEITDSSLVASDGTPFFNHSGFDNYNDSQCRNCHGGALSGFAETTLNFSHSVSEGVSGGADCALCHDTGGTAPRLISFSSFKEGVHRNLNSFAVNNTTISEMVDKACWACHGEGDEPSGHPARYRNPRRCDNNDCHSLSQSFRAPMIYSHFRDAALNSNPANVTNYNVSTGASCETCHSNSKSANAGNPNASVSHYATTGNLIGSMNCIYCHLDRDNAIKWGNATEINKNRTSLVEMNKLKNKFTAREGEAVELGNGYRLKVTGISTLRGSAAFELYYIDSVVDKGLINTGEYSYEEFREIDNATSRIPVIILDITGMFSSSNGSFIQFEGSRVKRLHYENMTTSCYLCHFNGDAKKRKYTVVDRRDDNLFYTEVLFNSSDREEFDQEAALHILANRTPADAHSDIERSKRKTLRIGERWDIAENYSLIFEEVADKSTSARFLLDIGGRTYADIVEQGEIFEYEQQVKMAYGYRNITVFRAKVSEILRTEPAIAVMEDILSLSPEIREIKDNTTISGYNTSWLRENNTFLTGRIPTSLHSPLLHEGRDGGPDCTSCHSIGALGVHTGINPEAPDSVDPDNKACWACHGEGKQPAVHPANYKKPRDCSSCHVEKQVPFFNATYIGDESHGRLENCRSCHVSNTHTLLRFDVVPTVKSVSLSREEVIRGETITINATATAGYEMRLRAAEYYIDSPENVFPMAAQDGSFDEQTEELTAAVDTSGLLPGKHTAYIRAMERNNKWSPEASRTFELKEENILTIEGIWLKSREYLLASLVMFLFISITIIKNKKR